MNDNFQIPAQTWTKTMVEKFQRQFEEDNLSGNYGVDNVKRLSSIIDEKMDLKDGLI